MNTLPRIEFYLEKVYELLSDDEPNTIKKALSKQEVMEKYHLTDATCSELFHCRCSPAYKMGNLWRVDNDDFDLWYRKYMHDIKDVLDKYIRKENTKRMIRPEADKLCRMLYGINLDEYIKVQKD